MAYDAKLADRVRAALRRACPRTPPREIRMFGGLCFTVGGNMCCGVAGRDLVVRVGPARYQEALAEPHARPMDFTGRPLKGFVYVGPAGSRRSGDVERWLRRALSFVAGLPAKERERSVPIHARARRRSAS